MKQPVSTVILAGGQGSRIGGDKALKLLRGRPLVDWVFDAMQSQSAEVLVSANENVTAYQHLDCPVIADEQPGLGPLAGLAAAMRTARHELVASVPCDTPFLPRDLVARLHAALLADAGDAAFAVAGGRRHFTVALYHRRVLPQLDSYLAAGGRKVGGWLDGLHAREVAFDDAADFANVNSLDDLALMNQAVQSE
jgi:molybdenum cofactor guanylyltransferase